LHTDLLEPQHLIIQTIHNVRRRKVKKKGKGRGGKVKGKRREK